MMNPLRHSTDPTFDSPSVFVYGTLMRGHLRSRQWPRKPERIERAEVRGELYDLGPYPAMVTGLDRVVGEVWTFAAENLPPVLEVLDQIEGITGLGDDLYRRELVAYWLRGETAEGSAPDHPGSNVGLAEGPPDGWAYCYLYRTAVAARGRILPAGDGLCRWPKTISEEG